jgi:hypothetical protein
MVAELTERLGLKMAPAVYIVDAVAQPFVWGWLRGSIIFRSSSSPPARVSSEKRF